MPKWILFLYRGFPDKVKNLEKNNHFGIFFRDDTVLVGIDVNIFNKRKRFELMSLYYLREFEVEQEKFDYLISKIPDLDAKILNIEILNSEEDIQLNDELINAIYVQDIQNICNVINKYRELGKDVEAIEFYYNKSRIRFTKLAELDVSTDKLTPSEIINTCPIGFLSGLERKCGEKI